LSHAIYEHNSEKLPCSWIILQSVPSVMRRTYDKSEVGRTTKLHKMYLCYGTSTVVLDNTLTFITLRLI